jgi:hypothetical protein
MTTTTSFTYGEIQKFMSTNTCFHQVNSLAFHLILVFSCISLFILVRVFITACNMTFNCDVITTLYQVNNLYCWIFDFYDVVVNHIKIIRSTKFLDEPTILCIYCLIWNMLSTSPTLNFSMYIFVNWFSHEDLQMFAFHSRGMIQNLLLQNLETNSS